MYWRAPSCDCVDFAEILMLADFGIAGKVPSSDFFEEDLGMKVRDFLFELSGMYLVAAVPAALFAVSFGVSHTVY